MGPVEVVVDHRVGGDAEGMVHGGVEVLGRDGVFDGMGRLLVTLTVDLAALDAAAGEHGALQRAPVVAAGVFVNLGRVAEFAVHGHEGFVEQPARGEVFHQRVEAGLTVKQRIQYYAYLYRVVRLATRFYDMQTNECRTFPTDIENRAMLFSYSYRFLTEPKFRESQLAARVAHWQKNRNFGRSKVEGGSQHNSWYSTRCTSTMGWLSAAGAIFLFFLRKNRGEIVKNRAVGAIFSRLRRVLEAYLIFHCGIMTSCLKQGLCPIVVLVVVLL